jgi:hypothetical protein
MLSILIPIYNYKVVPLVDALQKQCVKSKINYEILCFDDQSDTKYKKLNNALSDYFRVNYTELSENIGRARIRNWLAKSASYDTLLFLDCDSKIVNKNFIENYISLIGKSPLISGGRIYKNREPRAYTKRLHWLYGTKKESQNSKVRNRYPVKYFHSNNFLVDRQVILDNPFEEQLAKYGYEDLLYARQLQDQKIDILHLDNSIEHLGLEKNTKFLEKTKLAIDNLLFLKYRENEAIPTNIEQFANRLYDFGFHEDFLNFYAKRESQINAILMSKNPTLRALDMYKLHYYYDRRNAWISGKS